MTTRQITSARNRAAAVVLAAVLSLAAAGCGDGSASKEGRGTSAAHSTEQGTGKDGAAGKDETPDAERTLAVAKGADGLVLTLHSARRDPGGFVTVNAEVKNTGRETFYGFSAWRGNEEEIVQGSGRSVGGATLVDQKGKKRYYVLRDTEGRCLCTTALTKIEPGRSVAVFMQFPAPPESTTEVDFQLPTFPTATIELSS